LVGTKIYIYSDAGLIQDSAIIYSRGKFNVSKLKNQEEYIIKVGDSDYDTRKSELYALIKNERRKLSKLNQAYSYRPIIVADEEDTKFNFDKFLIEAQEPIAKGTEVYLYENDAERFVDTAAVAEDGSFQFKQLDREKQYSLKFDEQFDLANAKVYSVTEEGQKAVEQNENGFEIDPEKLLRPQQETITLILGDVEVDRDIQLDQKEIKPFPLTPPVNEKEEPILVEKNVVNETVFEPAPVKAKPVNEVKKAVATLDDSDWRSLMGKGDIYETARGYNLHFGFNEFLLNPNQIEYLRKVVIPILRANPELTLTIEGHTDNIGSEEVNHRMAVLRASNVLYHLEMSGVEDTRLRILAKGESQPIAPNDIPEGRAINRRVEIIKNQ
jgi:outer membrane protein OmpA-like peptidoglycan-associated protein